jgi:phospholipase C
MGMDQIEHVVVLMLENRSFDSVLGWLYEDPNDPPGLIIGPDGSYRGLQGVDLSKLTNTALSNPPLTAVPTRGAQGFTSPIVDPGEEFDHINQQFWGTENPDDHQAPTMSGVLADFVSVLQGFAYADDQVRDIAPMALECYTPAQLPVLNELARHYAVSDDWYASVPSQTNTNRAFLLCGTSHGMVNNGYLEEDPRAAPIEKALSMKLGDDRIPEATIFNELAAAGKDWAVFWQTSYLPTKLGVLVEDVQAISAALTVAAAVGGPLAEIAAAALLMVEEIEKLGPQELAYLEELSRGDVASSYTWRLFPQIKQIPGASSNFQTLDEFHQRARNGTLPAFSYIEPYWTISRATTGNSIGKRLISTLGNDYHPPSNLLVGEEFVKDVYTSLISNTAAWNKTLLLVTFDEFVGTFDHVSGPPLEAGAVEPPWGTNGSAPKGPEDGFKFDRLGGRVATIVVSPFVQKGTVFRASPPVPYDHTSLIATTLKWIGKEADTGRFGQRAANAPTFDGVLTLTQPRTDQADPQALTFLDTPRADGDPLRYGDSFWLQNQNGDYLTAAVPDFKEIGGAAVFPRSTIDMFADIGLAAYFPTHGSGETVAITLVTHTISPTPGPPGQVSDGDQVRIVSREAQLGSRIVLGIWPASDGGSWDCFYYDEYVTGDDPLAQAWTIQKLSTGNGAGVCYGDSVYVLSDSASYGGQRLTRDSRPLPYNHWVTTTSSGGDSWTIVPSASNWEARRTVHQPR